MDFKGQTVATRTVLAIVAAGTTVLYDVCQKSFLTPPRSNLEFAV